jgi:hypothetical protein
MKTLLSLRSLKASRLNLVGLAFAGVLGAAVLLTGSPARSENTEENTAGTRAVYGTLPIDQAEGLSTGDQVTAAVAKGTPTAVWETLERAERVECLNCIGPVESLLYDPGSAANREIAAWWLRRRIFGVFGPGEAYERTITTLKSDSNPARRAYAASALGEFLAAPGAEVLAEALTQDREPVVRVAAAAALGRMNSDGAGALARALTDTNRDVKLGALNAIGRVQMGVPSNVTGLLADSDSVVRKRAAELLDHGRTKEGVGQLLGLAKSDVDSEVRLAACHALGSIGDVSARVALEEIARSDANGLVRDQARIAAKRL